MCVGFVDSPCACVHFSRKTMNTKRKSILQFFTVFRLEIKWLKKRCKSIYLLSTLTHKRWHTHTVAGTHSEHLQYSYGVLLVLCSWTRLYNALSSGSITHTHTHAHMQREGHPQSTHTLMHTCCSLCVCVCLCVCGKHSLSRNRGHFA